MGISYTPVSPSQVLSAHRTAVPIDHPDGSITLSKFADLPAFRFLILKYGFLHHENPNSNHTYTLINLVFSNYAVVYVYKDGMRVPHRNQYPTWGSGYTHEMRTANSANDHLLVRWSSGSSTLIGNEAVDLNAYGYLYGMSISGSTFKVYRAWVTAFTMCSQTPKITITDTTYASGYTGVGYTTGNALTHPDVTTIFLPSTCSTVPQPTAVIEYQITGSGKDNDPFKPDMPQDLVEVDPSTLPPNEASAVMLNRKGPNGLPLVDRLAVSWGAIDMRSDSSGKSISPTALVAVYSSDVNKVSKHIDHAKGKRLAIYTGPFDYIKVKEIYNTHKKNMDFLITENELAYHLIGTENLEVKSVADFYEREVLNLGRIDPAKIYNFDSDVDNWIYKAKIYNDDEAEFKLKKVKKS
ncbi:MAG: hypothetical protein JZD41_06545 [Thermoproteus sp.]|nr:hypothetical protein [Thermoproteus sp.]